MADLTEEQAAIYDRQIRVWGADVQRRLMTAHVLVLGCTPLAAEVTKNFVLAGVGNLTIIDDRPAAELPPTFLRMHTASQQGTSAAMFAAGLQEMNPMVHISAAHGSCASLPDAAVIKESSLVICFGLHAGQQHRLNRLCREQGVKFMAAVSRGSMAYAFADLLTHAYCPSSGPDGPASAAPETTLVYVDLPTAAAVPLDKLSRSDQRQLNRFMGAWAVVSQLEMSQDRFATTDDTAALVAAGERRQQEGGAKPRFWSAEALNEYLEASGEFAPVNAVIGGIIANDVVRCISQVGLPTFNVLFFSMADNIAQVHNVTGGSAAQC